MKKTLASLFTMLLCFAFVSCGGESGPSGEPSPAPTPTPTTVKVLGVSLDMAACELEVGTKVTLVVSITPNNATNKTVSWSTSNASVATVSNGTITAVAPGKATITVTTSDGNKTATCEVTVVAAKPTTVAVTGVSLDKSSLALEVGGTATLTPTVTPSDATEKGVTWSSDKTSVATVDANGKVTAVAAGTATITVKTKDGEKTATCTVTVTTPAPEPTPPPTPSVEGTSVALSQATMSLAVGDVAQLTATVNTSSTDKSVTWASDNTSVATVDATGKVTAKAAGTANITATANDGSGKKATCKVTVVSAGNSGNTSGDISSEGQDWENP